MKNIISVRKSLINLTLVSVFIFCGVIILKAPNVAYAFDPGKGLYMVTKYSSDYINEITRPKISKNKIEIIENSEGFYRVENFQRDTIENSYAKNLNGEYVFKSDINTNYDYRQSYYPVMGEETSVTTRKGTMFYHDKTTNIDEKYNSPRDDKYPNFEIGKTYSEIEFGGQVFYFSKNQSLNILYVAVDSDSDAKPNKIYSIRIPITVSELKPVFNEEKSQFVLENTGRKVPCKDIRMKLNDINGSVSAKEDKAGYCYITLPLSKNKKAEDLHMAGAINKVVYTADITPDVWDVDYWSFSYGEITNSEDKPGTPIPPKATPTQTPLPKPTPIPDSLINNLSFGSSGERVKTLQNQLIKEGYLNPGEDTGNYDAITQVAVNRYRISLASPTVSEALFISANPKEIPSGATTTLFMTAHSNASSTELMAVCPQGVRADWLQSTESNKNICNVSKQLNPRSLSPMTLQVFNSNPITKEISVNFYERFPGNAYAFGSSTRIIVRGLASTTPQCLKLTTNMDEGSTGGEVVALQELLIKLGFLSKDLTQKGYYGPSTTAAVKSFQNSVNITATGSVGPLTREALNNKSCNGVIEDNRPITENAKSGSLAFRLEPANPSSRVVNISSTQNTSDVVLAIFDIKSEGVSSVLNSLKLNVNAISPNWKGSNVNKLFDRVYVKIGDKSYLYDSVDPIVKTEKGQKLVFSNMTAPLPADAWVPVTVYGVIAKNTNNILNKSSVEVVLYASDTNVSAVDGNFNNMKVVLKPVLYSGVATFAGSVVSGGISISNVNTSFGDPVISNNTVVAYPFFMTFTVNNNGDTDIFMSKKHVGNEIVAVISPNTATVSFADNSYIPATVAGDNANYVIIPSNTSRVVKYNGVLMNSGMAGYVSYRVTSIFYGNTADVTNNMSIKSGLEGLYIYAMFGGKSAAKDVNAVDTKTVNTTVTPTPTYSSTPTYSPTSTYTPAPVVTSTPVPTTYVAPASTPTTTTSPTPTTTASPTTTSSPSYNYSTPTYTTSPTSTARPTSSPVSNIFGEYQTASVWSLMLKFLRFTF